MLCRTSPGPLVITSMLALACATGACVADEELEPVEASKDALTAPLSGRIQAEAFRAGGEGVGYHDTTAKNVGGASRPDEGVDIEPTTDAGGGFNVGWTAPGEWLAYDVSAPRSGVYSFAIRLASGVAGTKSLHLELDGVALPSVSFADASGWQVWKTYPAGSIALTAGAHVLKVVAETGKFNFNYLDATAPAAYPLRFGVSATIPDATNRPTGTRTFKEEVDRQVAALGATAFFNYFQDGEKPHWKEGATMPGSADVVVSTKVADPAAIAAYVAAIPARSGKVYLHYWQEPEDDVEKKGTFTLQQFRDRTTAVHRAIPAGNTTVIPTVHLQEYWLQTKGEAFEAQFVPPTTRHVSWSLYRIGNVDPVASVRRIEAFMNARFPTLSWGIGAVGYPLPAGSSAADAQARADWLAANVAAVKTTASRHYMWFDTTWSQGDYRIANDPVLLARWRSVAGL